MAKLNLILKILRSKNIGYAAFHYFNTGEHNLNETYNKILVSCEENSVLLERKNLNTSKFIFISDEKVQQEIDQTYEAQGNFILFNDSKFPTYLKTLSNYPPLLVYRGNISNLHNEYICAISGSRASSDYSAHISYAVSKKLMEKECVIATGASGKIDGACHDNTYSQQIGVSPLPIHKSNSILDNILYHNGLVVTDVGIFEETAKYSFLKRNRLLVGLSKSVLIIESGINSGAYKTAIYGIEADRNVYIFDHFAKQNIYEGNKKLIDDGADIFVSINQILNDLYQTNIKYMEIKDAPRRFMSINDINLNIKEDIINISIKKYGKINFDSEAVNYLSEYTKLHFNIIQQILLEFSILF